VLDPVDLRPDRLLDLTPTGAELGLDATAVLLDRPVRLAPADPDEPCDLAAPLAKLANYAVPPLAELPQGTIARNRPTALEAPGIPADPAQLTLGAGPAGPGANHLEYPVTRLERCADRNQQRALGHACNLSCQRIGLLRLGCDSPRPSAARRPLSRRTTPLRRLASLRSLTLLCGCAGLRLLRCCSIVGHKALGPSFEVSLFSTHPTLSMVRSNKSYT